ncbi:MAG: hypothetical protein IKU35_00905 [Bacteroidaceae bacterium]|nr:hypothetical protein [Bacteroidaceae bacterium]MBR5891091.1 hypothetical protein [Bacteroidaceae bacterium]
MISEAELVSKVRTLLNEPASDSSVSLITDDTLQLDNHITALLPEAVLLVQMNRQQGVVNGKSMNHATIAPNGSGSGTIALPDDYVRLVFVKLAEWKRGVTDCYHQGSVGEALQCNKYMRAGSSSPVAIEGVDASNNLRLTLYPVNVSDLPSVEQLSYEGRYNASTGLNCNDERLIKAVAYQCAALLCNVYEKYDAANVFQGVASALCNNSK